MTRSRLAIVNRGSIALAAGDPFSAPLPGSEVVALNIARAFADRGAIVTYYGLSAAGTRVPRVAIEPVSALPRLPDGDDLTVLWLRDYATTVPDVALPSARHVLLTEDSANDLRAIFRSDLATVASHVRSALPRYDATVFASRWHRDDWGERLGLDPHSSVVVHNLAAHVPWRDRPATVPTRVVHTSHPRKALAAVIAIARLTDLDVTVSAHPSLYQDDHCRVIHPDGSGGWVDRGRFADVAAASPWTRFTAPRPVAEMAAFLDGFDILLHPDYTEETGATTVIEALRRGLLPVVSDRGALPELVGNAGLVIDGDSWTADYACRCADALAALTSSDMERYGAARAGRRADLGDESIVAQWAQVLCLDEGKA
ncbi:glycosyltransferase [Stackebrandtia soli]|uniref:glycosyltransferase n=1 Tax=Stackebrandtia soli TaxID=1892856 RepID=UPI0039ED32E1